MPDSFFKRMMRTSPASVAAKLGLDRYRVARLLGKRSRLTAEQSSLLAQMRADNSVASAPFRATECWQEVCRIFDRHFYMEGIGDVEAQYLNLRFSGFAPGDPRLHGYLVYTYFQLLRQRDIYDLLRRIRCAPGRACLGYDFEGCNVSLDLLFSVDDFYSLLELRPDVLSEPLVVADIGAGWGRLGYVLKQVNPSAAYVIFDLPEALLISSAYLPSVLPGVKHMSYMGSRGLPLLSRATLLGGGMWFLGSQDLARVRAASVDMVVNIASFQEMTEAQVRQYFEVISDKARGGHLFLKQLWSGRTHGHHLTEIAGYERYPFPPAWERVFLRNATFSHAFFETGYRIR